MNRASFLDRDGVINKSIVIDGKSYPPKKLKDVKILPKVPEALKKAKKIGLLNIIITNQPDITRGILRSKRT